ncbi:cytosolic non-specific dipeptidase-like isoform X2 [Onthophagus taurus]|nr:cytosolic non-specific dipeptidase-like isoform X2 [Onthophagus taurus]
MTYGEYYALEKSKKIAIQPDLLKHLQFCDSRRQQFIDDLNDAVKIKSVSGNYDHIKDMIHMIKFVEGWMIRLGIAYECFYIGFHELDGKRVRLPPVILASIGNDRTKKTVCIYGYLDVPLPDESKWNTDPWVVTQIDKFLYGNGVASGKSALMCWFHAIEGILTTSKLPINIKFIIESMHHCRSEGLDEFLMTKKLDFLCNIDYVVMCDSQWIGEKYPCITYGAVGIIHAQVTIEKVEGSDTEPKDDADKIFDTLIGDRGHVLIPEFSDTVMQISPDEEMLYEKIQDFDVTELAPNLEPFQKDWDQVKLLMHFWRLPSIYIEPTQICTCDKKDFSVVKKDFMIKIVPNQAVEKIIQLTNKHITNTAEKMGIKNKIEMDVPTFTRPWLENSRTPNYTAARRATIQIYKEDPSMIRDDRAYVIMNILQKIVDKNILLLPLGNKDINAGRENENITLKNYQEGTKLLAAYLFQLGYIG